MRDRLLQYITANPGQRMEEIGEGMGITSRVARRPLSKLLDKGLIRREGQKRASRYYPAGAAPARTTTRPRRSR